MAGQFWKMDKVMKFTLGNADKAATGSREGKHSWESIAKRYGGIPAPQDMLTVGGQKAGKGPDVLKFIKQHDPQNTAGAIKEAIDILTKLQDATKKNDLFSNIQPLQNILGGQLYNAMQSGGSKVKAKQAVQDEDEEDIIAQLIAAALAKVELISHELMLEATELLLPQEIKLISHAFYNNHDYVSDYEIIEFVTAINELMPQFRIMAGVKKQGIV